MNNDYQKLIDGLHEAAEFLERNREKLDDLRMCYPGALVWFFVDEPDHLANYLTGLGHRSSKEASGDCFNVDYKFGDSFTLQFTQHRSHVCKRIEREVVHPALPETIIPAKPERVETVVEWECPESLLEKREAEAVA